MLMDMVTPLKRKKDAKAGDNRSEPEASIVYVG